MAERIIETPAQFIDLQKECIAQVRFYINKANKKLGLNLPMMRVLFSIKGGTAGRAHIGDNLITFNPVLLRENPDDFLHQVTGHEVGHHAAYEKFGMKIRPHGYEWGKVMWCLGLPATRCHNYDTSNTAHRGRVPVRRPTSVSFETKDGVIRQIGVGKIIEFN